MPQATPFDAILTQARDLFSERLAAALSGMLDKANQALDALESETRDTEVQALYRETRDKALSQREKIETQFRTRYLREFQVRSNRARKIGSDFADIDLDDVELALVGEDDLEETLKFNAMTARLRQYCEEELVALDQRVGVLFGDAGLLPEDNPFAPQAIADAWKQTCAQVHADVDVRLVLLKLFDEFVLDEIRGIYRAVNALLVQNAILPKLRGAGVRKERAKAAPTAEPRGPEQDFFTVLQSLMKAPVAAAPASVAAATPAAMAPGGVPVAGAPAGTGGGAPAGVAPVVLQGPELLSSLTRVQVGDLGAVSGNTAPLAAIVAEPGTTNVLRELKSTSLGSGMSQMDTMTLDIVALLFDQLFDDPRIPIGVKGLIGRLQIPFLKVAIADKAFFSRKTHPARQMLDTLGEVAMRLPDEVNASSPTFVSLDRLLQHLMESFEDDIGIFDEVREKLEALVEEEDQRIEQQALADEKQVEQQESLALAKTVAQTEIKMRLRASRPPQPVLEFLHKQWIKVLLLIQVKEGEESEAWKRAIETMELLIWSVEPKDSREARREVVGKVPELLRRLTDALAAAGVDDAVRTGFIAELRKLHSEVIAGNGAARAETTASEAGTAATEEPAAPEPAAGHGETPEPAVSQAVISETVVPDTVASDTVVPESVVPETVAVDAAVLDTTVPDTAILDTALPDTMAVPAREAEERAPAAEPAVIEFVATSPEPPEVSSPVLEAPAIEVASPHEPKDEPAPEAQAPSQTVPALELPPLEFTPAVPPQPARPAPEAPAVALDFPSLDFSPESPAGPRPVAAPGLVSSPAPAARPEAPPPKPQAPPPIAKPQPPHVPSAPVAEPAAPAAAAKPRVAAKPQPAVAKPLAAALDLAAPVTVPNPFGEGEVEVNDLDFTVQLRGKSDDARPVSPLPPELKLGTWVNIVRKHGKEKLQTAKLTFISPLKTRYLFADRHGKTALECSQAELVRLFQLQEVTLGAEPVEPALFDRLAEGVMGKLGASLKK